MEDPKIKLLQLLDKEQLLDEEKEWILAYLKNSDQDELRKIMQLKYEEELNNAGSINVKRAADILAAIHQKIAVQKKINASTSRLWMTRIAIAASFIGIISWGTYWGLQQTSRSGSANAVHHFKSDVLFGSEKAILTLADGSKVPLTHEKKETISQGNTRTLEINGKLIYDVDNNGAHPGKTAFNTVTTPRGGFYQIELPDGSLVWLNAASSLRFPTAFSGKERKVEITGEAYFEVAKNKAMPFIVSVSNAEVRVLGTHFNVMAYQDEAAVKTTLLEGAVQFTTASSTSLLKPGEQAELNKDGQVKVSADIDTDDIIAWKNGTIHFEGADIATIMRQLSRSYDVDIVYGKKINDRFYADIPSKSNLSVVLKALELTGKVNFDIQGRKIIINP